MSTRTNTTKRRKLDDGTSAPMSASGSQTGLGQGTGQSGGAGKDKEGGTGRGRGGGTRAKAAANAAALAAAAQAQAQAQALAQAQAVLAAGEDKMGKNDVQFSLSSLSTQSIHSYIIHHSLLSDSTLHNLTFESVSRPLPRTLAPIPADETSSQTASASTGNDGVAEEGDSGGEAVGTRKSSRKKVASARAKDSAASYGTGYGVNAPSAAVGSGGNGGGGNGARKREREREEEEALFDLTAWDTEEEWRRRLCNVGRYKWDKEARSIREGETLSGFLYSVRNKNRVLKVDL
ncbi:hypothetical protein BT69DRAFT_1277088 [Atractiella rhizophila]|nr:hypothetical protein BT69DRAFT_1277088 [Atractiella rhizophila]